MTKHIVVFVILLCHCACQVDQRAVDAELYSLYQAKNYFALSDSLKKYPEKEHPLFTAALLGAFNQPEQSNHIAEAYLQKHSADSVTTELLEIKLMNYIRTSAYGNASRILDTLIHQFKSSYTERELADYRNTLAIYRPLKNIPRQQVVKDKDTRIKLNSPLGFTTEQSRFIFDTGANISVMCRSIAEKNKLELIDTDIEVGTISSIKVKASLGVWKELWLGQLLVKNAVFLILNDELLTIGDFKIETIIGFPIILAIEELHISLNKEVFIPQRHGTCDVKNLSLDGLTPVILTHVKDQPLSMTFDTGANTTHLYANYFKRYKDFFEKHSIPRQDSITGVGGSETVSTYKLDSLALVVGRTTTVLRNLQVLVKDARDSEQYYYGNLGLDYVGKNTMKLNFKDMCVEFD